MTYADACSKREDEHLKKEKSEKEEMEKGGRRQTRAFL
jgi:hypothetical protein